MTATEIQNSALLDGTPVELWCPSLEHWTSGFEIADSVDVGTTGLHIRRRSDGTILPVPFAPSKVRPASPDGIE